MERGSGMECRRLLAAQSCLAARMARETPAATRAAPSCSSPGSIRNMSMANTRAFSTRRTRQITSSVSDSPLEPTRRPCDAVPGSVLLTDPAAARPDRRAATESTSPLSQSLPEFPRENLGGLTRPRDVPRVATDSKRRDAYGHGGVLRHVTSHAREGARHEQDGSNGNCRPLRSLISSVI